MLIFGPKISVLHAGTRSTIDLDLVRKMQRPLKVLGGRRPQSVSRFLFTVVQIAQVSTTTSLPICIIDRSYLSFGRNLQTKNTMNYSTINLMNCSGIADNLKD